MSSGRKRSSCADGSVAGGTAAGHGTMAGDEDPGGGGSNMRSSSSERQLQSKKTILSGSSAEATSVAGVQQGS